MKNVKGSLIYFVSEEGEIYSSYLRGSGKVKENHLYLLKQSMGTNGYKVVHLYENGRRRTASVHRLVAESYIENPFSKREVNHIDGNKINNSINNLEWVTPSENLSHAVRTGLKSKPPRKALFSDEQVLMIRTFNNKLMDTYFANLFNVNKSSICKIRLRQNYKNLP